MQRLCLCWCKRMLYSSVGMNLCCRFWGVSAMEILFLLLEVTIASCALATTTDMSGSVYNSDISPRDTWVVVSGNSLLTQGTLTNEGTLTNDGTLTNSSMLTNDGTLTNNFGGTLTNSGTLTNDHTLMNDGTLTNNSGGTLTNSGTVTNDGALTNNGTLTNYRTLNNFGALDNSGGSLTVASGGAYNGYSGSSLSGGSFKVLSGGSLGMAVGSSMSVNSLYFSAGGTYSILGSQTGTVTLQGTVNLLDSSNSAYTGTLTKTSSNGLLYSTVFSATSGARSATLSYTAKNLGDAVSGNASALDGVRLSAASGSAVSGYFNRLYTSNDAQQVQRAVQQTAGEGMVNGGRLIMAQAQAFHGAIGMQQSSFSSRPHSLALDAAPSFWSTAGQQSGGMFANVNGDSGLLQTLAQIASMSSANQGPHRTDAVEFRGQAHWLHQGAHDGLSGYDAEMGLAALGYDTPLSENARIGFAGGFSGGQSRGAGVTANVKSWFFGPYGTLRLGPVTLDGDVTYTGSQGSMSGSYSFPVADSTSGNFNADTLSGNLKASHSFEFDEGVLRLIPSVGIEAVTTRRYAFTESGSYITRRYADSIMNSVGIPVGVTLQRDFEVGKITLTPEMSAFYVRQLADTAPTASVTLLDSTKSSSTRGADAGRDRFRTGAGFRADLGGGFSASARYIGEFGNRYTDNGAELKLKYEF